MRCVLIDATRKHGKRLAAVLQKEKEAAMIIGNLTSLVTSEESWCAKFRRILRGLRAPRGSGDHKYAVTAVQRIIGPSSASTFTCAIVLLLLILFVGIHREVLPPSIAPVILRQEVPPELDRPEPQKIETTLPDNHLEYLTVDLPSQSIAENADVTDVPDAMAREAAFGETFDQALASSDSVAILQNLRRGSRTSRTIGQAAHKEGSSESLPAVLAALRWLKANQLEDGAWAGPSKTGMCGLALLCYMAHGETPASPEFGRTVENAIRYLLYAQGEDGRFKEAGDHYVYGHAIAAYALAESYGMTKMVMLKDPVAKAIKVIIDGQQAGGAWNYDYSKADRRDMSVTGWQVQALKAAKLAGAYMDGLEEAIERSVAGVKSFAQAGGGFGYDDVGNRPTLTGAGALCLQLVGHAQDGAVVSSLQAYSDKLPAWEADDFGTYGWYYMTQAKFQHGGVMWDEWNKNMLPMLIENQADDGHWASGTTHQACDVYDTTLACLCLEVYYRHLPTYWRVAELQAQFEAVKDGKDIAIEAAL